MDRNEAISVLLSIKHFFKMDTAEDEALDMAIKALEGKDIDVPTNSALDHIHNVVRDDAYKRGYEHGKAEEVPAITLEWIGEYLAWLKGIGGFGLSDARAIQSMIIKWKMDNPQNHSSCGTDYCDIGGHE